ncbi:Galactokinase [Eremomyces bilateralis CBS 781.70]|uniref:Galactokinase n=1 Tax=Eremomyces bilateralis CBS 781.70 TaxID=1392243 RepID=A0A6G1G3V1_9PEZI|nr:Galactokinase [Eremomyces bilateralis CBS 781.70]KAF1812775.1 Galactokinase [Eremomyces bilateralis CBS 781.70]
MAITADVIIAVAIAPSNGPAKFRVQNVDAEKFAAREFEVPQNGDFDIDATALEWSNYFKSGLRGALELLKSKQKTSEPFQPAGMDILIDGTVPPGGGLSSSAAFVCASALAAMRANGVEKVDKTELVELAVVSERAVGVNSGGMDQAASVFSARGSALYVSFVPELKAKLVSFPETDPELVFLIAQSFVVADKHVTAPIHYNLRVVECTIAANVLFKIFGLKGSLPEDKSPLGNSLRSFHEAYFQQKEGVSDPSAVSVDEFQVQLTKLVQLTEDYMIQEEGYTREEIGELLGIDPAEIDKRFCSKFAVRAERFKLRQRALHVFTEALRVGHFYRILTDSGSKSTGKEVLEELGSLMNTTQESCRDIYECSCPELDTLCELARGAGSYGSRLTGAGWGGCTVHLVPKDKVEAIKDAWRVGYYAKKWPEVGDQDLEKWRGGAVVVSRPGSGSALYQVPQ